MNKTTEPAALAGIEPVAWQCNAKRRITTEYVYERIQLQSGDLRRKADELEGRK